jgi:transketolase
LIHEAYSSSGPGYIRIDKGPFKDIYDPEDFDFSSGISRVREGTDLAILSTGVMVQHAIEAGNVLAESGINARVLDVYRLKPVELDVLLSELEGISRVVTLEEHTLMGGLGSIVGEALIDSGHLLPMKRIGIKDVYRLETGSRNWLWTLDGLDTPSVVDTITTWGAKS